MQDWRFDDLTRSLGRATSRRQVFKGLLGGLAAAFVTRSVDTQKAAAAPPCDPQQCKDAAFAAFEACLKGCGNPSRKGPAVAICRAECTASFFLMERECHNSPTGCFR